MKNTMCYTLNMGCAYGLSCHSVEGIDSSHHSHLELLLFPWLETVSAHEHTLYAVSGCWARICIVRQNNIIGTMKVVLKHLYTSWKMPKIQLDSCPIWKVIMQPYTLAATCSLVEQKFNTVLLWHIDWFCASWLTIDIFLMQCSEAKLLKRKVCWYAPSTYLHTLQVVL